MKSRGMTGRRERGTLRRALVLGATGALVATMLPGAAVAQEGPQARGTDNVCEALGAYDRDRFDDTRNSAHERNVLCMESLGLTEGTNASGGQSYAPRAEVTRGQMASFIARFIRDYGERPLPDGPANRFDDVSAPYVHTDNINALAEVGIVEGTNASGGDLYAPQASVDRGQTASLIRRALSWLDTGEVDPLTAPPAGAAVFPDVVPSYVHFANVNSVAGAGIVQGFDNGEYRPREPVLRDQMASFVMRGYDYAVEVGLGVDDPPVDEFGEISGTVSAVFADGPDTVLEGATVSVDGTELSTTTGADGSYTIEDAPAGTHSVTADAIGFVQQTQDDVVVVADTTTTLDFVLLEAVPGSISGTVYEFFEEDDDSPLEGATVFIEELDTSTTTDADGTYSFLNVLPDTYTVTASADGYASESQQVGVGPGEEVEDVDFFLGVAPLFEPGAFTMFVEAGGVVIGTDEDEPFALAFSECPDGEPANGECITFEGEINEAGEFTIPADGVSFPDAVLSDPIPIGVTTTVAEDISGTIDPDTGEVQLELPLQIDLDLFNDGTDNCRLSVDLADAAGVLADGRVSLTDDQFGVPATEVLEAGLVPCAVVDDAVGLPSASGDNEAVFNLLLVQ